MDRPETDCLRWLISHWQMHNKVLCTTHRGPLHRSSYPCSTLSWSGLNPIKLARQPDNASSPDNRAYYYAELAVSSLAVAVVIVSTLLVVLIYGGMARLSWQD